MKRPKPTDAERLTHVLGTVRDIVPDAVSMTVGTSDQHHYGFVFSDVVLTDGASLYDRDPNRHAQVDDAVSDDLNDLDWNGVVDEDRFGYATVPVPPATSHGTGEPPP